ncbi:exported protein [Limnohabitans sp. MORI2]|uniref:TorF family putative porin n=1 Tax=Limnohabitans sp. MORI2 TaxID=1751150 RepID=UPI002377205F|nr:TorF family putative porin [Limnohabitans sp. MORI2]BDU57069.1 exported protein [Limnohabitans sp. MORI2]
MNIKSKLLLALLATSSAAFAQTAPAAPEVTYNVGVVSQYRYRGIAQTKGDPALQGGIDYANANGFYLGAWASTIKWIKDAALGTGGKTAKGPVELDLYGGYKFEAGGLAYDVGYLRYQYVGNTYKDAAPSANVNANTDEVYGAATYGPATLKYSQATSNLFGYSDSKGSTYWDLSATFDLGNGYSIVPHAGRQSIKNANQIYGYSDFALTLNKDLGDGLTASVAAIKTTADETLSKGLSSTSYYAGKNAVVVGVKYAF